jgi:hypothetical protein
MPSSISFSSNRATDNPLLDETHTRLSLLIRDETDSILYRYATTTTAGGKNTSFRNSSFKLDPGLSALTTMGQHQSMLSSDEYFNLINDLINLKTDLTKFRSDLLLNELKLELAGLVEKMRAELAREFAAKLSTIEQAHLTLSTRIKSLEAFLKNEATDNSISDVTSSSTENLPVSFFPLYFNKSFV